MVPYFNPGGHNFAGMNLDGWGISQIVFITLYSIVFYAACGLVWHNRSIPVIKMRSVGLSILSLLVLHIYVVLVFLVYPLNGYWPCDVEYWVMAMYLPIGIGLFQAQNQQLLIVSRGQQRLLLEPLAFKPLGRGWSRLRFWWSEQSYKRRAVTYVVIGGVIQFVVSIVIFTSSRKFHSKSGIVDRHGNPEQCRRGWEWVPTIVWQFVWNYGFGPMLLWKIKMIRDVYHWRLQTTIAIIAGLPGTPLWLAAVYSENFDSINKYWIPAMWFLPGLFTIEILTLAFPLYDIYKSLKFDRYFTKGDVYPGMDDLHSQEISDDLYVTSAGHNAAARHYSPTALTETLNDYDGELKRLKEFACTREFTGENIVFLSKVLRFRKDWSSSPEHYTQLRHHKFEKAVRIYLSFISPNQAYQPVNIGGLILLNLTHIFGPAAALFDRRSSAASFTSTVRTTVAPWEEQDGGYLSRADSTPRSHEQSPDFKSSDLMALRAIPSRKPSDIEDVEITPIVSTPGESSRSRHGSIDHIIPMDSFDNDADVLAKFPVPDEFDELVFDEAYKHIFHMVWAYTWQNYMKSLLPPRLKLSPTVSPSSSNV